MIPYTSYCFNRNSLRVLRRKKWRLLTNPKCPLMQGKNPRRPTWADGSKAPYALDNGAWGAFKNGIEFDCAAFERAVNLVGNSADWIVIPDVLESGPDSYEFSVSWMPSLSGYPVLFAVQDGMTPDLIRPHLSRRVGIFLGGSTDWKLSTIGTWARLSREIGCHFHVGRVNTARRIRICQQHRVDSFDGSGVSRWIDKMDTLDPALRQTTIWEHLK